MSAFSAPMAEDGRVVRHFASFIDISGRVEREPTLSKARETLNHCVEPRTRRLRQVNARPEEEIERHRGAEAVLRDALARSEDNPRFRDFLIREVNYCTENALQLATSLLLVGAKSKGTVISVTFPDLNTARGA